MQVKEGDRPKTAFSTHRGQFQWRVMSFGLTNGPASFTRLMNLALSGLTWTHCLVYLDDIIIWAPTFEDHLHRLWLVFNRVRAAGLKLKPIKCQFLKREVTFLGHVVSSDGIKTDPEKVKAVETRATPLDVKELQTALSVWLAITGGLFPDSLSLLNHSTNCVERTHPFIGTKSSSLPLKS